MSLCLYDIPCYYLTTNEGGDPNFLRRCKFRCVHREQRPKMHQIGRGGTMRSQTSNCTLYSVQLDHSNNTYTLKEPITHHRLVSFGARLMHAFLLVIIISIVFSASQLVLRLYSLITDIQFVSGGHSITSPRLR